MRGVRAPAALAVLVFFLRREPSPTEVPGTEYLAWTNDGDACSCNRETLTPKGTCTDSQ